MKKLLLMIFAIAGLSVLLVACSDDEENAEDKTAENTEEGTTEEDTSKDEASKEAEAPEVETIDEDKVVATVNGEEIIGKKYNQMYSQTLLMFQQYGQDTSNTEQVKEQTITSLIEQELLLQETDSKGIEVSDSEVEDSLEQIKSQFESDEQFKEQLTTLNLTEDSLKEQLAYEIRLNQYMAEEVPDIEVSQEEVDAYYEQLKSQQGEETPPLEDVQDQIENELVKQQRSNALGTIIEDLKEESEIETLI
ncbi:SurA N-terminal domain-containing protein [Aquibacillus saliphilus]|uniref:SurA N-terminal domain-containing protein n=1 Tax=Aquibacillus saliphilus TaxID=1909422 RepID=UPI001CEFF94B|nr:SurA N-terminal domain-containing protein [Aquibacillus saliphilus]